MRRLLLVKAVALTTFACSESPVAPLEKMPGSDKDEVFPAMTPREPMPIGSVAIPNGVSHKTESAWTGFIAPESTWVRVTSVGLVNVTANPEYCRYYGCQVPYDGASADPGGIPGTTYLRVDPRLGSTKLTLVKDPQHSTRYTAVHFSPTATELQYFRPGVPGGGMCTSNTLECPKPEGGSNYHEAPAYLLSGSHALSLEVLPSPSVTALETLVSVGDSVQFEASVAREMTLSWHFQAGDTLADPSGSIMGST